MKILLGIALALGIAAAAYGAAATLNVDGSVLQYGADTDLTCDTAVTPHYTTAGATDPTLDTVRINDIAPACLNATSPSVNMRVALTGTFNGGSVEIYNGAVTSNNILTAPIPGVTAQTVTDVHVTFYSN